jgi:hypothetical protein
MKRLLSCPDPRGTIRREALHQRGSVLIELALVAPIILLVAGWAVRVTQILQAQQVATVLSREIATEAFRFCIDRSIQTTQVDANGNEAVVIDTFATGPIIQQCIRAAHTRFITRWNQLAPIGAVGAPTLDVVAYRYNFPSFTTDAGDCNQPITRIPHDGGIGGTAPNDPPLAVLCQRNRMIRVELAFDLQPIFAFLNLFPNPPGVNLRDTIRIQDVTEI